MSEDRLSRLTECLRDKGYCVDGARFPTGRNIHLTVPARTREHRCVVVKQYPLGKGQTTFQNMQDLWCSSFGKRRSPPGLPEPIDYLDEIDVLIMERMSGKPLIELDPHKTGDLDAAIDLIAALHGSDARPATPRNSTRIIKSLRRKATAIAELSSCYLDDYLAAIDALERSGAEDPELVPCHGDFSPRNVLMGFDGARLIDWDRLRRANPARDVAYMACWYWAEALRRGESPSWSILKRITARYEKRRPDAQLAGCMKFHLAAGLLRMAHSRLTNPGHESRLVPHLIREAGRQAG